MSKKFYAERRDTGERWSNKNKYFKSYLVMYDSGYLAVVDGDSYYIWVTPLDTKVWRKVIK